MNTFDDNPVVRFLMRHRGMFMPCAAGLLLFVILIPLPPFILDFLLTVNIMLSFVVLVTVFYLKSPLEFSSFPWRPCGPQPGGGAWALREPGRCAPGGH